MLVFCSRLKFSVRENDSLHPKRDSEFEPFCDSTDLASASYSSRVLELMSQFAEPVVAPEELPDTHKDLLALAAIFDLWNSKRKLRAPTRRARLAKRWHRPQAYPKMAQNLPSSEPQRREAGLQRREEQTPDPELRYRPSARGTGKVRLEPAISLKMRYCDSCQQKVGEKEI